MKTGGEEHIVALLAAETGEPMVTINEQRHIARQGATAAFVGAVLCLTAATLSWLLYRMGVKPSNELSG